MSELGMRTVVWFRIDESQLESVKSAVFEEYRKYHDSGCLEWDYSGGVFVVRVYVSEAESEEELTRIARAELVSLVNSMIRVG